MCQTELLIAKGPRSSLLNLHGGFKKSLFDKHIHHNNPSIQKKDQHTNNACINKTINLPVFDSA